MIRSTSLLYLDMSAKTSKKSCRMSRDEANMTGNAALIMVFILGFPILDIGSMGIQDVVAQHRQSEIQVARPASPSNEHRAIDLIRVWRVWTPLAPQDISLTIRCDIIRGTIFLRLQNNSDDARFMWQD